jgi:hypothetical protein
VKFGPTSFIAAVLLARAVSAGAGDASGSFAVKGPKGARAIRPTNAAAFVTRDTRNPRQEVIEVVLSDQPLDAAAAAAALAPHTDAINQKALMQRDYVLLWVRPDGGVSMNATFGATMTQYIEKTGATFKATLTENTPTRVAGRVFTTSPVTTMDGESFAVELTFAADVSRLPAGKALPAGGADPGKALLAFLAAVSAKNWPAIEAASSPRALKFFKADYRSPEENAENARETLGVWLPRTGLAVTGGTLRTDSADLEIEGDMFPGTKGLYVARLVRIDGVWKFDGAAMIGML